tara:strand:+ start:149 stop:382 length:234 start_codon:yes stop_codon:yes gene_type:complete
MPKYKSNNVIRESFIEKLFTSVGKGLRSKALKHIAKTDPEIAKSLLDLEKTRKEIDRRIKNLSKSDKKDIASGTYFN